jgi:hypothetical protein
LAVDQAQLTSDLDGLARAYARLSRDVGGRIDFACDSGSDDALKVAEQEKYHLDQAFFVLSFAALEKQLTLLASVNSTSDDGRALMRKAKFEQRLQSAIKVVRAKMGVEPAWSESRSDIQSWYGVRNDIAHGNSPATLFDIPPIIDLARKVEETLGQVAA